MEQIIKVIENGVKVIIKLIETVLKAIVEPAILSILDIVSNVFKIKDEAIIKSSKIKRYIANQLKNKAKQKVIINKGTLIYYTILTCVDIGLASEIVLKGKIPPIKVDELVVYGILYIIGTIIMLNVSVRYSELNSKIKLLIIIQTLAFVPIIVAYWIVSIEGKTFYLNKLDINQWSSIFNNMLIYFATCVFGVSQAYKITRKDGEKLQPPA